jgi:hypothetical protein
MKYVLLVLFCFSSVAVKSQQLNLDKLKAFIYQPVELAADTLQKGGWTARPELSGKQANQLYQTYSYGNHAAEQAKAMAWLRIHADNGKINQVYYQTPGVDQYTLMLQEIKKLGTEKKDPDKMEAGIISTYYVSSYYTYQTIVGKNSYTIMVTTNNVKQD